MFAEQKQAPTRQSIARTCNQTIANAYTFSPKAPTLPESVAKHYLDAMLPKMVVEHKQAHTRERIARKYSQTRSFA